jgi:hypothetical protein
MIVDGDKLIPIFGKDKDYDEVMIEVADLESHLDDELLKLEYQLGCVNLSTRLSTISNYTRSAQT